MNIKKVIAFAAACCITATAVQMNTINIMDSALEASAGRIIDETYENLTYRKYRDFVTIVGCDKSAEAVEIPAEIDGLPVTIIGDYAFSDCYNLISITIPDSVTSIGDYAFDYTPWLGAKQEENPLVIINNVLIDGKTCEGDVVIPDGVMSISGGAFSSCKALTSITIPDSVTSIGDDAFSGCTGLTSIIIPDSVTSIGDFAFSNCNNLTSITIPDSVISIGDYAFSDCYNLISITIPDSVTSIGDRAFSHCSGLTSITIPDSVISIGDYAFGYTPWLEAKQEENPLVVVNNILIDGKTCEGDVVIPDGVMSISGSAFFSCEALTSITIPDSVTSIGDRAFSCCSGLTSITIPDSVTSIGDYAFGYTPWLGAKQEENPLVVVNNILIDGKTCEGDVVIPDGVTHICSGAFYASSSLTSITIPDSVTSIGHDVFSGCIGLTSVTIPDSMTSISDNMFSGCTSLESVTIPDGVTNIGNGAFSYCSGLTSITIPDSVTSIGYDAFMECDSLKSVTILNPDCEIYDTSYTICSGYDDNNNLCFNGIIRGYSGSTAETYAEKYGYNFESIGEIENPEILSGDANCDGKISIADATLVLQYCGDKDKYKLSEQGLINADVDGTAGISAMDALKIQEYDTGIIEKF